MIGEGKELAKKVSTKNLLIFQLHVTFSAFDQTTSFRRSAYLESQEILGKDAKRPFVQLSDITNYINRTTQKLFDNKKLHLPLL